MPATVVVFFELNWEDPEWAAREKAAATLLAKLREAQAGRSTRLVAILQQSKSQSEVPDGMFVRCVSCVLSVSCVCLCLNRGDCPTSSAGQYERTAATRPVSLSAHMMHHSQLVLPLSSIPSTLGFSAAIIEERARSLRSACKLMTKSSLFTLDTPDARLPTAMHK